MPSIGEVIQAFSTFVTDNIVLIAGAVVVGLVAAAFGRLIRSGR